VKLCVAPPAAIMDFIEADIKMSVSVDAMILGLIGPDL
jgi:hypothetical protein